MNYQEALIFLEQYNQEHLLRFYDELDENKKANLLEQISSINLERIQFMKNNMHKSKRGEISPLGALTVKEISENREKYKQTGIDAIRNSKVGAVLLAGGQGSRLGFDHSKGMFNIGKTRSLYIFECLINSLLTVTNEAQAYVPLIIMTSETNDGEIREFLEEHNYFGYSKDNIHFFIQEMEPAVDENGKILMSSKDQIVFSPNGNGGWFSSMQKAGLMDLIEKSGIEWLNVFAVDNVLQKIADPVFIGATIESGCVSGGKVVSKSDPDERVGVLCLEDGKPSIVEYYEMMEEMRTMRDSDGNLSYRFGVILNYLFRVDKLIKTLDADFPFHAAHKKISCIDENGCLIVPDEPNGYKFETLVLDMVHMQDSCLAFEVEREKEFAPVKNASGTDSVDTARKLLEKNGITL
ncbi:MAG: UTP--glucose-1-phosphate uridylyltransferase [Porcipelethomonas sp.]